MSSYQLSPAVIVADCIPALYVKFPYDIDFIAGSLYLLIPFTCFAHLPSHFPNHQCSVFVSLFCFAMFCLIFLDFIYKLKSR